ncbi:MAG: iron-containing alcohol dehydrogenase [Aestuariibacter sp.]
MQFSYQNPTTIQFGQGQIATISELIDKNAKVLLLYGGGSIKRNGVYDQVTSALQAHDWVEFSGIEPNPTVETLDKAVTLVKQNSIDFILAVGGGSVIDGAKYVAAASKYDGQGWDIMTGVHTINDALAMGCILTLPATGSESNGASVVSKKASNEKLAFVSPLVYPQFAVLDPDTMKTLPSRQLANGLADAWVHVCEQYLTYPVNAMVQDGYAETLLRNILQLAQQFQQQDDSWRANFMWTANQALSGLIGAGVPQDWATHMMGHELTALYGVDHARSLAIVQPHLLRHQLEYKSEKLAQMGRNVFHLEAGEDLAERTVTAIEQFYQSLEIATQLTDYGSDKQQAVETVLAQLSKHRLTKLGENKRITLDSAKEILSNAIAG